MKILAIDTTGNDTSVALINSGECVGYQSHCSKHSDCLISLLNDLLNNTNYTHKDVDAYAVTTGPGSFTGIRVGIAAVLGMKLVTKKQVCGITNFEAYSFCLNLANKDDLPISIILKAHRDLLCGQVFNHKLEAIHDPVLFQGRDFVSHMPDNCLVGGDCADFAIINLNKPLAVFVGMMAYRKIKLDLPSEIEPVYFMKIANWNGKEYGE